VVIRFRFDAFKRDVEAGLDLADEGRSEELPVGVNDEALAGSIEDDE
jgi:hypothetical protein